MTCSVGVRYNIYMTQTQALEILKTGANVFLTGEPGSGKTFVVNKYVEYLRSHSIAPAITASTGIAATHIGGMTIHSWSGIGIKSHLSRGDIKNIATNDYVEKRISAANVLIIDEISMLPPETLQMIEVICREVKNNTKPFGGLQIVLVGDFFQLPPVVKKSFDTNSQEIMFDEAPMRFAYDSPVWQTAEFVTCYLSEQYRQDDIELSTVLAKIRRNGFDQISLDLIRQRRIEPLQSPASAPKLYSHNLDVDRVNDEMLAKISSKVSHFTMLTSGRRTLVETMKKGCLSPENLLLKVGAAVMFTKNNPKNHYVNGTLGTVCGFDDESDLPIVKIRDGRRITVTPADWTVEENGAVKGRLTQLPLRLAWAITVHKSQGISLDEAVVDLSKVFEFGQGYVAISRVRRLTGLHILGWNDRAFQVDPEVLAQDQKFQTESTSAEKMYDRLSEQEMIDLSHKFILAGGGEIETVDFVRKNKTTKPSTYDDTLKLWQAGEDVVQIATSRNLSRNTILTHLEKLVSDGRVKKIELDRIIPDNLQNDLAKIQSVFKDLDTNKLSPVFTHFHGKYSYEDLRLAKLLA